MSHRLFILVYRGDPLDYSEYRHTALYVQFASQTRTILHILGTQGLYRYVEYPGADPMELGDLVRAVPVTDLSVSVEEEAIRETVARTPVRNGYLDLEWNCQHWVGDALARLVDKSWVTEAERADAIDKMTDACLEARDDQLLAAQ
ncbi:hypothetical protein ASPBRDRAFT_53262 [Aspergillus brasiliensis CBS 101740]|uniref:PPPDE domain-containing protein n=1 Tax=Aspergillus brasiliensis (strain CBS 101740 / IMI 381727 / IBT 21946) TaxID=767769 RepID=A0A1L9UUU4_ASPBC|nr:hypothetical protein ASPBRDRAFT_53262 [Aspergillus brasiliensis CBS 101740]